MSCVSNYKALCSEGIQRYFVETGMISAPCPICRLKEHEEWADKYFDKSAIEARKKAWLEKHPPVKTAANPQATLFEGISYPG